MTATRLRALLTEADALCAAADAGDLSGGPRLLTVFERSWAAGAVEGRGG